MTDFHGIEVLVSTKDMTHHYGLAWQDVRELFACESKAEVRGYLSTFMPLDKQSPLDIVGWEFPPVMASFVNSLPETTPDKEKDLSRPHKGQTIGITWSHPELGCMCSVGKLVGETADGYLLVMDIVPGDGEQFFFPASAIRWIPKPVTGVDLYESVKTLYNSDEEDA